MPNVLTCPTQPQSAATRDQIQIALAIADDSILKSLLVNCTPAIARPSLIGTVSSSIGVAIAPQTAVDGIIQYESIHCALAPPQFETEHHLFPYTNQTIKQKEYQKLTRCEAETRDLGQNVSLDQALSLLTQVGFSPRQVDEILSLSYEACHKSWWYLLDSDGNPTVPFLRLIRTLRYPNGSYTIQYKDYFSQEKPCCFQKQTQQVLVKIKTGLQSFSETLERINYCRNQLDIKEVILICDTVSDLEARGFISQGISLYAATDLFLPAQANCANCVTRDCPMNGTENSPVLTCRRFCLGEAASYGATHLD
ncbi:MAG: hypothetical protein HC879_20225 [Leptolyngbyaceae cyanobacterium SL_5_9]|nr:hypothetical protein [Leptolyngbyaceae cyanobacterium SM1_4_3]NJM85346.1 hypothetical protein [Leptolyngbyaceae cyanobacterium RM2_2_21]NJN59639.1 hypothetical protein [Leptolyngbyaceae cyanobacterium SL_5_9]NJO73753.1 hypothetical protein [Leptolyngbyaceae cyanobacterium RM1_406_9]